VKVNVYDKCERCEGDGYSSSHRANLTWEQIATLATEYRSLIQAHKDEAKRIAQYLGNLPKPLPKPHGSERVYINAASDGRVLLPTIDALLDVLDAMPLPGESPWEWDQDVATPDLGGEA